MRVIFRLQIVICMGTLVKGFAAKYINISDFCSMPAINRWLLYGQWNDYCVDRFYIISGFRHTFSMVGCNRKLYFDSI